jgi:hypothetical protein
MSPIPSILTNLAEQITLANEGDFLDLKMEAIGVEAVGLLSRISANQHPLGFYHLELTAALALPERRVRMHIWTAESIAARDELGSHHAHTWTLASCVLVGSLRDTSYRAIEVGDGEFSATQIHYPEELIKPLDERFSLIPVRSLDVAAGYVYRLPDDVPHNTEVTSLPTATLVVARESGRTHTPIFSRQAQSAQTSAQRRPVMSGDIKRVIAEAFGL